MDDRSFPPALAEVSRVEFDYADGDGVDFEPLGEFPSAEETTEWFQAWTGNHEITGDAFRIIGRDGTGGYAALWLIRDGQPLNAQPVVFLGSEGLTGVVARNVADFLWLLADSFGPMEATEYPRDHASRRNDELTAIAERSPRTPGRRRPRSSPPPSWIPRLRNDHRCVVPLTANGEWGLARATTDRKDDRSRHRELRWVEGGQSLAERR